MAIQTRSVQIHKDRSVVICGGALCAAKYEGQEEIMGKQVRSVRMLVARASRWAAAVVIALGTVLSWSIALAQEQQMMSIDEMKAMIIGNSLSGTLESGDIYVEHYKPNGEIVGLSKESGRYQGKWSFRQDGLMCFRYGDGPFDGGCVHLTRDGDKVGFTRVDGTKEPTATLVQGMAPDLKE